jgi:hypothetical protein
VISSADSSTNTRPPERANPTAEIDSAGRHYAFSYSPAPSGYVGAQTEVYVFTEVRD